MTQEAFLSLIVPLQPRLFRFAFSFLHNKEDAKDVVQDVIVKIWQKKIRRDEVKSVEAWCMRITKNTILDRLKYNSYRMTMSVNTEIEHSSDSKAQLSEKIELADTINSIKKIIAQLPQKQKFLIHLRDVEGFAYQEIAEIMELSIAEVKIGIFRARQVIREKLKKLNSYGLQ